MAQDPLAIPVREDVNCSLCGTPPPAKPEFEVNGFSLVRCSTCGVLRVSPRLPLDALKTYYDPDYWKSRDSVVRGYFNYPGDAANIRRTFERRLKSIQRWIQPPGRWLDVGCACGFLVEALVHAGWDAWGVDWSRPIIQQAPEAVRDRLHVGSFNDLHHAPASLDVISMWDYLEHSPDPRSDLSLAQRWLKPGGILSLIIPDAGSWLARLMGPRWEEYKKPQEHLYFFTRRQITQWLEKLGWSICRRSREGKYATLDFAFSRFQTRDGIWFWISRSLRAVLRALGLDQWVVYINPRDKLHLIGRKEPKRI